MSTPTVSSLPTIPTWTFGERVKKARKHAGLERKDLAKHLGLHPNTIANWERDETMPSETMARVVARRCGVNGDWLWGQPPPYGEEAAPGGTVSSRVDLVRLVAA